MGLRGPKPFLAGRASGHRAVNFRNTPLAPETRNDVEASSRPIVYIGCNIDASGCPRRCFSSSYLCRAATR